MLIVSDTGPVNYLALIGHVEVLHLLFGEVVIPQTVFFELTRPDTPGGVRTWIESQPAWVKVMDASELKGYPDLDAGESEAIALAKHLGAEILCDDRAGRKVAAEEGLRVSGTLGVLQVAHLEGLLDIKAALASLSATNYRHAPGLFEHVLRQALEMEREQAPAPSLPVNESEG